MLPLVEVPAACPVCTHTGTRALHVIKNTRPIVQVPFLALGGCPMCGFVFTWPRPSEAELARYYDPANEDGFERGSELDDPTQLDAFEQALERKRENGRRLFDGTAAWAPVPQGADRHAFDFGCGAGSLLDVLQDRGWMTTGLEPHRLREVAARRHRMLTAIPAEPVFDFVIAHHVLEHVLLPVSVMAALAAATRPGGILLASMPNLDALPEHGSFTYIASSVHLNSFTSANIRNLCQLGGWRVARAESASTLSGRSSKDAERLIVVAVRDNEARTRPLQPNALAIAEDALRRYGRSLGPDGKPQRV